MLICKLTFPFDDEQKEGEECQAKRIRKLRKFLKGLRLKMYDEKEGGCEASERKRS